jgi:hypothetical protein
MGTGPNRPGWEPLSGPQLELALDSLEQGLQTAIQAIEQIRAALIPAARVVEALESPALRLVVPPRPAPPQPEPLATTEREIDAPPLRDRDDDPYTPFERLWERMEHERGERQRAAAAGEPERHGLDLLPQIYMVTVEDRERRVDLVPLHRALLGIEGIEEISLASYANGVPVVSLRAKHALDLEQLRSAVESTLRRSCEVIPQDTGRVFLRLTSPERIGV